MLRILPTPAVETTVEDAYAAPLGSRDGRPWVTVSMVTSIDGSTALGGVSGDLSNSTDSAILGRLRQIADVIIVGAGTARAEGYGPPRKPGQRIGVVTTRGRVDARSELFASGSGFVITTDEGDVPRGVDVLRCGRRHVDLQRMLTQLPMLCGEVRTVQAEGGPSLNGTLLDAGLVDEIDVTTAAAVVGGEGSRLVSGAAETIADFRVEQLATDEAGYVFARWVRG